MYENFYGFREPPFRITPDPRFLYRNPCYEEAAAALAYGIDHRKGFLSLVGEAGTGKTTLLRYLLESLSAGTRTVLLLHPTVSFEEILEYILMELGVPVDGAKKLVLLQRLNEFLLEHTRSGGNVALLIDEAQDLDARVLEELRLLSNLETGSEKILQILLAGQPELEAKLAQGNLRQLRQRIAMHVRLRPLAPGEVVAYVHTRLEHAGSPDRDLFTVDALARIADVTGGIPRIVNVLCDACLVTGFATGSKKITAEIVDEAWADYSRLLPPSDDPVPAAVAAPAPSVVPPDPVPPPPVVVPPPPPAPAPVVAAPPPEPEPAPVVPEAEEPEPKPEATTEPVVAPVPPREPVMTARTMAPPPTPPAPEPAERARRLVVVPLALSAVIALVVAVYSLMPDVVDFVMETPTAAPPPVTVVAAAPSTSLPAAAPDPTPPGAAQPAEPDPAPVAEPVTDPFMDRTPPTPAEARALVHEFRLAYEDRDVPRLMTLFSPDASENGIEDLEAIAEAYRTAFAQIDGISYTLPDIVVVSNDDRVTVSGPFVITYRQEPNGSGEMRGTASWDIERRDGKPRIVALRYSFAPGATASR